MLFFHRRKQPVQGEIVYFPLPCPTHKTALIPEMSGTTGEYRLYCPLCRLASQPVIRHTEPLALETRQEVRSARSRSGNLLHAQRAKQRFVERLSRAKHGRLVLLSAAQTTDALSFAGALTEAEMPTCGLK